MTEEIRLEILKLASARTNKYVKADNYRPHEDLKAFYDVVSRFDYYVRMGRFLTPAEEQEKERKLEDIRTAAKDEAFEEMKSTFEKYIGADWQDQLAELIQKRQKKDTQDAEDPLPDDAPKTETKVTEPTLIKTDNGMWAMSGIVTQHSLSSASYQYPQTDKSIWQGESFYSKNGSNCVSVVNDTPQLEKPWKKKKMLCKKKFTKKKGTKKNGI